MTQADLNVKYTVIESPINGIISKLAVDTGNLVGKGEPTLLATVSAVHPIFADFSIAESDLPAAGQADTRPGPRGGAAGPAGRRSS